MTRSIQCFKNGIFIFLMLIISGCVTTTMGSGTNKLVNIGQVTKGMTKEQVTGLLGQEIIVGYEALDEEGEEFKPILMANPQRKEIFRKGRQEYEILFYFTDINQADGSITDDEIVPLVFANQRLVGKDWYYLNKVLRKK